MLFTHTVVNRNGRFHLVTLFAPPLTRLISVHPSIVIMMLSVFGGGGEGGGCGVKLILICIPVELSLLSQQLLGARLLSGRH